MRPIVQLRPWPARAVPQPRRRRTPDHPRRPDPAHRTDGV